MQVRAKGLEFVINEGEVNGGPYAGETYHLIIFLEAHSGLLYEEWIAKRKLMGQWHSCRSLG